MSTTHVTGRIVEAGTGRPIVDANVADAFPPRDSLSGNVYTDLDGSFALAVFRPGHAAFCVEAFGDTVARVNLAFDARARVDITIEVDTAGRCEPAYDVIRGEFTGHFQCGLESSSFTPDGDTVVDTSGADRPIDSVWVDFRDDAGCDRFEAYRPHWIRCVGDLIGPGRYGHFGMSRYLLVVREILDIRALEGPNLCFQQLTEWSQEEVEE